MGPGGQPPAETVDSETTGTGLGRPQPFTIHTFLIIFYGTYPNAWSFQLALAGRGGRGREPGHASEFHWHGGGEGGVRPHAS